MGLKKFKVAVIMGSDSDWPIMKQAVDVLKKFKVSIHKEVVSAHRNPKGMKNFAETARSRGISIVIAGAGGAAHLPGMVAAQTSLPVIGVPIPTRSMDGLDSLLSIAQMPKGIPVATVAVGGAANAAYLALRILGVADPSWWNRVEKFQAGETRRSKAQNKSLK